MSELVNAFGLNRTVWASSRADAMAEAPLVIEALGDVAGLIAEAKREFEMSEALYRQWRASAINDALTRQLKITEWKARALAESEPAYRAHYDTISAAEERLVHLQNLQITLLEKSRLIAAIVTMSFSESE